MRLSGRIINGGQVKAEAVVVDVPFSFIGDFDPKTGTLNIAGQEASGLSITGKILVCPTGKGGTIAPFITYDAKKRGTAPAAILCESAEAILCESALAIDIPILDRFEGGIVDRIKTGQMVSISENQVTVERGTD